MRIDPIKTADPMSLAETKIAKQRQEIARLNVAIEEVRATKASHVFRLRMILLAALDGSPNWREAAMAEVGRKPEAAR